MIKRFILGFLGLFLFVPVSEALIQDYVPAESVTVNYNLSVAGHLSTTTLIIDRSDTVNWPHLNPEWINIDSIKLSVDGIAVSTVVVKIGVVTKINASSATIAWFHTYRKELNVTGNAIMVEGGNYNPAPSFIRLRVIGGVSFGDGEGSTPYMLTNDEDTSTTAYQSDVVLPSLVGNTAPGIGDVILQVLNGITEVRIDAQLIYHSRNN